jgi:uncharacterized protein (TIGR00730 family)
VVTRSVTATQPKAYEDLDFLKSDVCRAVRLQLEFLKPDTVMDRLGVRSTIVLFGSARIPCPETASRILAEAEVACRGNPADPALIEALRVARTLQEQSHYYNTAREFAALASRHCQRSACRELVVITGGGGGIMEAGNRGAHDVGAVSIGLNISLPFEQVPNPYITPELSFQLHYFSIRKMHFLKRARALCAFPGGFGTMDELFETLTLIQTRKIPRIPVVLFGREFWQEIINWEALVRRGLISPQDLKLFRMSDCALDGWNHIRQFYGETTLE